MGIPHRLSGVFFAASLMLVCNYSLEARQAEPIRLNKGTRLMMDLQTALNSATTRENDSVLLRARNDIKVRDRVAIPQGTLIKALVTRVQPAFVNSKSKHAELHIQFQEILLSDGTGLDLPTDTLKLETEGIVSPIHNSANGAIGKALGGALLGGILGGPAGGRLGGLGGLAVGAIGAKRPKTVGADVDLPSGSIIETRLTGALVIPNPDRLARSLPAPSSPVPSPQPTSSVSSTVSMPPTTPDLNSVANSTTAVPVFDAGPTAATAPLHAPDTASASSTKTPGVFSLTVNVKLVQVDAVVRNKNGQIITGIPRDDVRVFEDGIEQQIQNFSTDELPLAVALVIDRSGSVAPIMSQIQTAAFKALQHLKQGDQVALFSFAGNIELLEELTTDRQRVANRIGRIEAGGGTRIVDAANEALSYLALEARDRRRAVIVISDNIEGDSRTTVSSVAKLALESESVLYSVRIRTDSAPVFPLQIPVPTLPRPSSPSTPVSDSVSRLARETGGETFDARASALDSALDTAVRRLKLRYTLGYAPTVHSGPGRYHTIEVRLADRFGKPGSDYTVLSRRGYYE